MLRIVLNAADLIYALLVRRFYEWLIFTCSSLKIIPNVTKLRNRAKNRSIHFIDVMGKAVRTLNKLGFWFIDHFKLNFTNDEVVKLYID